jgi:4-amino-4-deoxy-L-arabinose transferase-like glycosyltransferase
MDIQNKVDKKQIAIQLIPCIILFSFFAHHFIDLWSKSAKSMILLTIAILPIVIFLVTIFFRKTKAKFHQISKTKRLVFYISSALISIVFTLLTYSLPETFTKITITPEGSDTVTLLEIKVAGDVVNINDEAGQSGWNFIDGAYSAGPDAKPLVIYAKAKVNSLCNILFTGSSETASVSVSSGMFSETVSFIDGVVEQKLVTFHNGYRGVPGVLFIVIIGLIDLIAYSIIVLFLLVLQENLEVNSGFEKIPSQGFKAHLPYLLVLFFGSVILHLWVALAVPLIVDVDSPTYIQGAIHLVQEGNLQGVSSMRGPGTTFLFAPIFLMFGRNPWGLKIYLHLIGVGSVFVGYWLGWQLSGKKFAAFLTGLLILLSPDIYLSSVFVMSDALNLFFVALFCAFVIYAYRKMSLMHVLVALLSGSFLVFLRSENLLVLLIGTAILAVKPLIMVLTNIKKKRSNAEDFKRLKYVAISFFVAVLPLLWWSLHNYYQNGFFGLSDYAGVVLFDGWVYFGDASGLNFSDKESAAMEAVESVIDNYPVAISDGSGAATGWEVFPFILEDGYTREEAFDILHDAAMDSIKKDWNKTFDLFVIKVETALTPDPYPLFTFPMPGEDPIIRTINPMFFDDEDISVPFAIQSFRNVNNVVNRGYRTVYRYWFILSLISIFFVLHKKPNEIWFGLCLIVLAKIFISNMMSIAIWRYTISAVLLLQVFLAYWLSSIIIGLSKMFNNKQRAEKPAVM